MEKPWKTYLKSSVESNSALIGVDWGTSSLRAFLIGTEGEVLDRLTTSQGIMRVADGDFSRVLKELLAPWLAEKRLPIIASGMITSRNGWLETPYLSAPAGAAQLAGNLHRINFDDDTPLHFVTGMSIEHSGAPDVMRGEETQIAGVVEAGLIDGVCVMPGTHSKWITVRDRQITDFQTVMTGEVFAALRQHTILGTLMKDGAFSEHAFRDGVRAGFKSGENLLHYFFRVRTLPLFDKLSEEQTADYLSGMLIGAEANGVLANQATRGEVNILGRGDLAERYTIALEMCNQKSVHYDENIVVRGHFAIANAAGLLK